MHSGTPKHTRTMASCGLPGRAAVSLTDRHSHTIWRNKIDDAPARSAVRVAVIGPPRANADNLSRLHDESDMVRPELVNAPASNGLTIVPTPVEGLASRCMIILAFGFQRGRHPYQFIPWFGISPGLTAKITLLFRSREDSVIPLRHEFVIHNVEIVHVIGRLLICAGLGGVSAWGLSFRSL